MSGLFYSKKYSMSKIGSVKNEEEGKVKEWVVIQQNPFPEKNSGDKNKSAKRRRRRSPTITNVDFSAKLETKTATTTTIIPSFEGPNPEEEKWLKEEMERVRTPKRQPTPTTLTEIRRQSVASVGIVTSRKRNKPGKRRARKMRGRWKSLR